MTDPIHLIGGKYPTYCWESHPKTCTDRPELCTCMDCLRVAIATDARLIAEAKQRRAACQKRIKELNTKSQTKSLKEDAWTP